MKIKIEEIGCVKCIFDDEVNPVKLQFKAKLKYDLVNVDIDFEILMNDIDLKLKDNPIKLYTYRCDNVGIISENHIINENLKTIENDIINYLLNNKVKVSWHIFAVSHHINKKELRLVK